MNDEFAQTRPPDDLFDDEVVPVPVPASEVETSTDIVPESPSTPSFEPGHDGGRGSGSSTGRYATRGQYPRGAGGRGGGQGRGYRDPAHQGDEGKSNNEEVDVGDAMNAGNEPGKDVNVNVKVEAGRPAAVRGDRSGTGGVKVVSVFI